MVTRISIATVTMVTVFSKATIWFPWQQFWLPRLPAIHYYRCVGDTRVAKGTEFPQQTYYTHFNIWKTQRGNFNTIIYFSSISLYVHHDIWYHTHSGDCDMHWLSGRVALSGCKCVDCKVFKVSSSYSMHKSNCSVIVQ